MMLLMQTWQLPPPSALISVVGPAVVDMSEQGLIFTDRIKHGLRRAARKMGAWTFTNGSRDGIPSIVGQAIGESEQGTEGGPSTQPVIGILPWASVAERGELADKQNGQVRRRSALRPAPPQIHTLLS